MSVDVECKVSVWEENGRDVPPGKSPKLVVRSHWNRGDRVALVFGDTTVTVLARDLTDAVANATNRGWQT